MHTTGLLAEVPPAEVGNIVERPADDPELEAAFAEARRRWPELTASWAAAPPGAEYFVKAALPVRGGAPGQVEHLWFTVRAIDGRRVTGVLDNDPVGDVGHKAGDVVTLTVGTLEDWLIGMPDGTERGGFTTAVLERRR